MRQRTHVKLIWGLVAVAALLLAGCGRLSRTATLNQATQTPGAAAAVTVQQQLATHGYPRAKVTCSKTLIVNVGTTTTCSLTGAGSKKIVRFTFNHKNGTVKLSSVKAVS
jgi:hypothetical protein